jgi:ADP-heptose:LPS heptosyltransferase
MTTTPPHNILVLAEGQLGDLLLLTPALRAIKTGLSRSSITVLILQRRGSRRESDAGEILEGDPRGTATVMLSNPYVDRVFEVDRQSLKSLKGLGRVRGETAVVRWVRLQKFDAVVCTFPEDRFAMLAYLSGAGIRVGQRKQNLHWLLTVKPDVQKHEQGVLSYYCALAMALGVRVESGETEFTVSGEASRWAGECIDLQCGRNLSPVLVHPGASGDYKIWPPERFASLVDRLSALDIPVLLCGGDGDRTILQEVRIRLRRPVPVVVTDGNLERLGALFAKSTLVVSNDSGPRHLAIAVGARTLTLFRKHHDREWNVYPDTPTCRILRGADACPSCPPGICSDQVPNGEHFGSHCMRMIGVDETLLTIRGMLSAS